jgi:hypothetical protein
MAALSVWLAGDAGVPTHEEARRPPPLIAPIQGQAQQATPETYDLHWARDGSGDLTYDAGGFSVRIARDGGVSFHDKHFKLPLNPFFSFIPTPGPTNVPTLQQTILGLARDKKMPARHDDAQTDDSHLLIPNLSRYRPDPREGCRACSEPFMVLPINATGSADLTDEVMRFNSQDPYRYQKARFLVATRALRTAKAADARAEDVRRAVSELPNTLNQIACDDRLNRREQRAIIVKLREELDGANPDAHALAEQIDQFLKARFDNPDAGSACALPPRPRPVAPAR